MPLKTQRMAKEIAINNDAAIQAWEKKARVEVAFRFLDWYRMVSIPVPIPQSDGVFQCELPAHAGMVFHQALDTIDDYMRATELNTESSNYEETRNDSTESEDDSDEDRAERQQ